MALKPGVRFIRQIRVRPCRPSYTVDTPDGVVAVELPFVMGVLADLGGDAVPPDEVPWEHRTARGELEEREFLPIDTDNFNNRLKAMRPRLSFSIPQSHTDDPGEIRVDLAFESLNDFSPAGVVRQIALLKQLLEARDGVKHVEDYVNRILHHEKFQRLEGIWRGLYYLVANTQQDEMLKIKVLNVSKRELAKELHYNRSPWGRSFFYRQVYSEAFEVVGGEPFGCLIGDYYFDPSSGDVEVLYGMAKIAAAAHCPFIAGASPSSMMMDSWQELNEPDRLAQIFEGPDYAHWQSLRDNVDSRYLGFTSAQSLHSLPRQGIKAATRRPNRCTRWL